MPPLNFDALLDRRATHSTKWSHADPDMIPMWIADMDFPIAPAIRTAIRKRADHAIYGYQFDAPNLRHILADRLKKHHKLSSAAPDEIVFMPGIVVGLNLAARLIGAPQSGVVTLTPVYPPFLSAPGGNDKTSIPVSLTETVRDGNLYYEIDFDRLEHAIAHADVTPSLFMLCNPHNPVGRAYSEDELSKLAEVCLRHQMWICSDEIHADLTLNGTQHISIAALAPEIAARTITLLAPSKAFNVPGAGMGFAHVVDADLRARLTQALYSSGAFPNVFGYAAAEAAYTRGAAWLRDVRTYLTANRDLVVDYVAENLPRLRVTCPEATYLAWIDCRDADIEGKPANFFTERAKVWMNDGAAFGRDGEGFVRMNYGCPRPRLLEALERLRAALYPGG
jgi:cystathionine beta-lyase